MTWLRSICEKSNVRGVETARRAPGTETEERRERGGVGPDAGRPARRLLGLLGVSRLRTGRPRGQCMDVHCRRRHRRGRSRRAASAPAARRRIPTSSACSALDVREPERRPPQRSSSAASTSRAPSSSRCSRASTWSCTSPASSTRSPTRRSWRGSTWRARATCSTPRPRSACTTHRAHLERHRVRRVAEQPGAAHRGRAAAPEPALLARGAGRRGGAPARRVADRAPRRDGHHPALGAGRGPGRRAPARPASCSGARRCASGARRCRCRSCTSTTWPSALALAATQRPPGRVQRRRRRLARRRRRPRRCCRAAPSRRSPQEALERALHRTWELGVGDVPPGVVPYLVHPWVIANDKLRAAGWSARHSNADAIREALAALPPRRTSRTRSSSSRSVARRSSPACAFAAARRAQHPGVIAPDTEPASK